MSFRKYILNLLLTLLLLLFISPGSRADMLEVHGGGTYTDYPVLYNFPVTSGYGYYGGGKLKISEKGNFLGEFREYYSLKNNHQLKLSSLSLGIIRDFPGPLSLSAALSHNWGSYTGNFREYPESKRNIYPGWGAKWGLQIEQTVAPLVKLNAGINRRYLKLNSETRGTLNLNGTEFWGGISWGF